MKSIAAIRNRFLGMFAALLILTQSIFAVGMSDPYAKATEDNSKKTEVKQEVSSKVSYVEVATRVTLATFLFYWIVKAFHLLDAPVIKYKNCKAFFINSYSFNVYYTYLSALAP